MFQGCISLKEITIPSSVKGIHSKAFTKYWGNNGEMNLETVNIENEAGEVMIDSKAFESNTKINYLGKPKKEKTAPQSVSKKEEPKTAVTIDLEKLIAATLVDGVVTDKERAILCKKVKEAGGDVDEFEMLLDARIYEAQQKTRQAAPKAEPKKEEPKPASKKEEPKPAPKPEPKKEEPKPEPKPEPELETKEDSEAQEYNRAYWVDQSSEQNLELVDHILEIINSVCQFKYDLKYNKAYIGLALNGKPRVFVAFLPQKGDLRISIFVKQAPEFDKILAEKLDSADCYKTDQYKFHVQVEDTEKKGGFFAKLLGKTASNLDALKPLIIQAEKELR